jgi:hypothetical protein
MRRSQHSNLTLLALVMTTACGGGQLKDELEVVPFPSTHILQASELEGLTPGIAGRLTFGVLPPSLAAIKPGEVIVAGLSASTPRGLLRIVTDVRTTTSGTTLDTLEAPVQLAFRKLHVKASRKTSELSAFQTSARGLRASGLGGSESTTASLDVIVFDGDGDPSTTNDQVVLHGDLGGGFDYQFSLDVDWGGISELPDAVSKCVATLLKAVVGETPDCSLDALLPEAKVTFDVDPRISAGVELKGAAVLSYEKDIDLLHINEPPLVFGPLVFFPVIDITARIEGEASSIFSAGLHGGVKFKSSVAISSKHQGQPQFTPPSLESTDFSADPPEVALHARAKAGIGARLNLLLYAVTGPYVTARVYGAVT